MKVTDHRMFTLDGELRDEYRHLSDAKPAETRAPREPEPERSAPPPARAGASPIQNPGAPDLGGGARRAPERPVEGYPEAPAAGGPSFFDLVGLLAEPASIYLREAQVGEVGTVAAQAQAEQNLELARLHIDLLSMLREKTAGNLDAREEAMIDDVIYRLRMGYVQVQG